ncbi:hypothetical protein TNCV_1692651 [Trichonephila clavipes]|nr:hypothetical protein TNCV_1692651 [Trichonephila clavipes]
MENTEGQAASKSSSIKTKIRKSNLWQRESRQLATSKRYPKKQSPHCVGLENAKRLITTQKPIHFRQRTNDYVENVFRYVTRNEKVLIQRPVILRELRDQT